MKKIPKETIKEVEKIYGKELKEELGQAEILMNNPVLLKSYY